MTDYFDDLSQRLRSQGMPDERIAGTVQDLAAYVADSGADPREEFGAPEEFAARLADSTFEPPGPSAETWVWTADAVHEVKHLNEFGDQGWEVERVNAIGCFVSRRDRNAPQRWEYRRETVRLRGESRTALAERLAPEGWEPCGAWICYEYFKRPKAADLGPAAALADVPAPPGRRAFWSRNITGLLAAWGALIAAVLAWRLADGDGIGGSVALIGGGALLGLVIGAVWSMIARRSSPSSGRNP
ncbi:hypothetical protein [Spirillospora sp. NPDC029432]|uniref:hypothetical protein n=1 Tax=Spirillospora sp. NPDC029432 TaxID=3154599 RepID=UPI003451BAFB